MKKTDFKSIEPFKMSNITNKEEVKDILENIISFTKEFAYLSYLTSKIDPNLEEKEIEKLLSLTLRQAEKIDSKIENKESIEILSRIKDKEYSHKVNPFMASPELIATECSARHIQSVLEHNLIILNRGTRLLNEALTLNPKAGEIGLGKLYNLRTIAGKLDDLIDVEDNQTFDKRYNTENKESIKKKSSLKNK